MRLVQKYGGSSVADVSRIRRVAERVAAARRAGHEVVVVVSAMGNSTNELLALARQVSPQPGRRELDMLLSVGERVSMALLAMALGELQIPARSFTGSQSGILTDEAHAAARVIEVRPERIEAALAAGEVAIVAGFQGMSLSREITTLGRGGSDTTAVVLAAALRADECEICSDVDGIWSADPRTVPGARKIDDMSLAEALALARNGAKVLFEDAVAWAERQGIALRASATAGGTGTRIRPEGPAAPRMLAVTRDEELGFLPLDRLADIPAPCIRLAGPWGCWSTGGTCTGRSRGWSLRRRWRRWGRGSGRIPGCCIGSCPSQQPPTGMLRPGMRQWMRSCSGCLLSDQRRWRRRCMICLTEAPAGTPSCSSLCGTLSEVP